MRHLGDEIGFEIGKLLQLLRGFVLALVRLGLQQRHAELGGDLREHLDLAMGERIGSPAAEVEGADHLVADDQRQDDLAPNGRHAEGVLSDAVDRHVEHRGLTALEDVGKARCR